MATRNRWSGDHTIQTNQDLASEYGAAVAPFFLGSRGGPNNIFLRQAVEAAIAMAVNIWTVTDVSSTPHSVGSSDHVLLVDTSSTAITVNLPAVSAQAGRILLIKDKSGNASSKNITVARAGSDTIDGATSVVINSNYGAIAFISGNGAVWHSIWVN